MKIVYCLPQIYKIGGIERIVSEKMNYLAEHGYEVSVITTDQKDRPFIFPLNNRIKHYDLNINYEDNQKRPFLSKIYHFLRNRHLHKGRLKTLLLALKADITISTFDNEMSILPQIPDGSKKIAEFHFCRDIFKIITRSGIAGWMDRYTTKRIPLDLKRYDRFVVLSQEDAEKWKELNNIHVIHNCAPLEFSTQASLEQHKVISVGRYEYQKGFEFLIQAWKKVAEEATDWTLHIIGEGSQRPLLTKKIDELGLKNSVFLDGISPNLSKDYLSSSFAVFSSRYEGFLMAIAEAESAGLPVISFDTPCGPKDIIRNNEDGILVPMGNIELLSEKILLLIKNEERRKIMGEKAKENAKRFSKDKIMAEWMKLFHEIVNE